MFDNKKILAIIPARGDSKSIPKKNIYPLLGKPLIAYSIEAGLKSKYLDNIYVSSDCEKILETSQKYGTKTIKRPAKLAQDNTPTNPVIKHAVLELEKQNLIYNYVMILQPTSPLRSADDIDQSIEKLFQENNDMLMSITEADFPPEYLISLENDVINFFGKPYLLQNVRRQRNKLYYKMNGAIMLYEKQLILKNDVWPFAENKTSFYIMPKHKSIDIDTLEDLKIAETILKIWQN